MKKIDINVILTFCSYKEYGSQEIFDVSLSYGKKDKSARKLLDQSGFFDTLVQICRERGRLPTELVKISTAADWTKNGFEFDIENGKWSFGSWRGQNISWSDNLVKLYSFGMDDDTADCDLNLHAMLGIMAAKNAAKALKKIMSN
ncbi:hypothetical protein [Limnohabitans sp. Rim28]|uniref:hypothetical protein n=1 Tax=Limnohabitans sp. Rim28 TaxID=1100720 RepID=UPI0010574604|nr:hypothetical protein [Limnohabitans sp. Rim28]